MGIKSLLSIPYAKWIYSDIKKWSTNPVQTQNKVFNELISKAQNTQTGKEFDFKNIKNYSDFKVRVPIRNYEDHKKYIDEILDGKENVLWPGKPIYFCKTSGTTSGIKYIPITKDSISNHIHSARNALLTYIATTGNSSFVDGKMIFLSGSPVLEMKSTIPYGRLSGIVNHHVPTYLRKNQMPSYTTNCIEDWEEKVNQIADETISENMTLISGIPSWVQMYFEKILEKSDKKTICEIFPSFSLFVYGGVNYEPYRSRFENLIGKQIDSIELYPASEGFIAFQDSQMKPGLLLILNKGIFYEFIPVNHYFDDNPPRYSLEEIELEVNYAIILNTNAGLWGYSIGDTVKFISKAPYRLIVTGRIAHYTSAFGEHVIAEEVDTSLSNTIKKNGGEVIEYTVAPQVTPTEGLPYHEWFIAFSKVPNDLTTFSKTLDQELQSRNIYYKDLIKGKILQPLVITPVKTDAFETYMKNRGKLGGQNKVPRLSNDREIATELEKYIVTLKP